MTNIIGSKTVPVIIKCITCHKGAGSCSALSAAGTKGRGGKVSNARLSLNAGKQVFWKRLAGKSPANQLCGSRAAITQGEEFLHETPG